MTVVTIKCVYSTLFHEAPARVLAVLSSFIVSSAFEACPPVKQARGVVNHWSQTPHFRPLFPDHR